MMRTVYSLVFAFMLVSIATTGCVSVVTTATGVATNKVLGDAIGNVANTNTLSNVISSVAGSDRLTQNQLLGAWKYNAPACAFVSDKALVKAGGEIVAAQVQTKLTSSFQSLGATTDNTFMEFHEDSTFSGQLLGKELKGRYVYAEDSKKLELQDSVLQIKAYAKQNANGVALLFEPKDMLTIFKNFSATASDENLKTINTIAEKYDDVRLGFGMTK